MIEKRFTTNDNEQEKKITKAIRQNDTVRLKTLIAEYGIPLVSFRQQKLSPLVKAARYDNVKALDQMASYISNDFSKNGVLTSNAEILNDNSYLFSTAIKNNSINVFNYLIKNLETDSKFNNVDKANPILPNFIDKQSPLHIAAYYNRTKMIQELLNHGAELTFKRWDKQPHFIETHDGKKNKLLTLLENFKHAIINGDLDTVKQILPLTSKNTSLLTFQISPNQNAIDLAMKHGQVDTLEYLINSLARNKIATPKEIIDESFLYHKAIQNKYRSSEDFLFKQSPDLALKDNNKQTPLHVAAAVNNEFVMDKLLGIMESDINYNKADAQTLLKNNKDGFGLSIVDYRSYHLRKNQEIISMQSSYVEKDAEKSNVENTFAKLGHEKLKSFIQLIPETVSFFKIDEYRARFTSSKQVLDILKTNPDSAQYLLNDPRIISLFKDKPNAKNELSRFLREQVRSTDTLGFSNISVEAILAVTDIPLTSRIWNTIQNVFRSEKMSTTDLARNRFYNETFNTASNANFWMKAEARMGTSGKPSKLNEAIHYYQKINPSNPTLYVKAQLQLANIWISKKDYPKANEALSKLIHFSDQWKAKPTEMNKAYGEAKQLKSQLSRIPPATYSQLLESIGASWDKFMGVVRGLVTQSPHDIGVKKHLPQLIEQTIASTPAPDEHIRGEPRTVPGHIKESPLVTPPTSASTPQSEQPEPSKEPSITPRL